MNRELESLAFYIALIRDFGGMTKSDFVREAPRALEFVEDELSDVSPRQLERRIQREWRRDSRPLSLGTIDIGGLYDEAVRMAFSEDVAATAPSVSLSPLLDRYVSALRNSKGDEDADATGEDVCQTWDRIEYVLRQPENMSRAYGLAVGRVQSGKTQNYLGLILRAIDAGWNTIILLTSKNKLLAKQTNDRIESYFRSLNLVVNPLSVPTEDGKSVRFRTNAAWNPACVNFGLALKDHNHIDWVNQWLVAHAADCPKMKILIVDDESDNATPDGRLVGGVRIEEDSEVLAIADEIGLYRGTERGAEEAAQWVRGLIGEGFSLDEEQKADVRDFCEHTTTRTLRGDLLSIDRISILRSLGFVNPDGSYREVNGYHLFDKVMRYFDRKKPRNSSTLLYAKTFVALLRYVAEYRPSHSVINAAMRVIAGRPKDVPGRPTNDVRPYEYGTMAYVAYTATPYANLLNEDPMRDPLAPDFIKALRTSRKYIGFTRIFGRRPMNIVKEISALPSNDERFLLENLDSVNAGQADTQTLTFTIFDPGLGHEKAIEWKTLKTALSWFVCSAAARRVYRLSGGGDGRDSRWSTMILNIAYEQGRHQTVVDWVSQYLAFRLQPANRQDFRSECLSVWSEFKNDFSCQDFERSCEVPYPCHPMGYPSDEDFQDSLEWFLARWEDHIRIVEINSSEDGHDGSDAYYDDTRFPGHDIAWILCGGNVISRGLTLEGLTTSYFNRVKDSSSVDTITQMGRWFGYRMGYELLPRIWMTADTKSEMQNFCRIEERMHNMLHSLFLRTEPNYDNEGREIGDRPLSPVLDREAFGIIISFGRSLSGRSNAARLLPPPGLGSIRDKLDEFVCDPTRQYNAKDAVVRLGALLSAELGGLRVFHGRRPEFGERYHGFPYWRNVEKSLVQDFLLEMVPVYPAGSESGRKVRSLVSEISRTNVRWDIVFADPVTQTIVDDVLDGTLHGHSEQPTESADARTVSFRRNHTTATGFFSNVSLCTVNQAECFLVEEYLKREMIPDLVDDLAAKGISLFEELQRVRTNPIEKLRPEVRGHRCFRFSKNSHLKNEYVDKVFSLHQQGQPVSVNPILLIDFVRPDGPQFVGYGFYPVLSYYWPGHDATDYMIVVAGGMDSGVPAQGTDGVSVLPSPASGIDDAESVSLTTGAGNSALSGVDDFVARIREEIRNNRLVAVDFLREQVLRGRDEQLGDFEQAMLNFIPINSGVECDHTPLSRGNRVFADPQWLSSIAAFRDVDPERYFQELNRLLEELVHDELRYQEGMGQEEFGDQLRKAFPGVFRIGDAVESFWPRYDRYYGNGGHRPIPVEELSPADEEGVVHDFEDDIRNLN